MQQRIDMPGLGIIDVVPDDSNFSPLDYDYVKMDISPSKYNLPIQLDIDWEALKVYWFQKQLDEIKETYHVFWLDCYIHSWIAFSLAWEWMQCQFDTARKIWIIAVPKIDNPDVTEAEEYARKFLGRYNAYLNWEFYCFEYDGVTYGNLYDRNDIITTIEWLITGDLTDEQRSVLNSITD